MSDVYTFPAGRYYIGDLCYVMRSRWGDFCDKTICGNDVLDGAFEFDGLPAWFHGTVHGDGAYPGAGFLAGTVFPVDAGLIGVVPVGLVDDADRAAELGLFMEFHAPLSVSYEDGTFFFESGGHEATIATDAEEEEEEEEEYLEESEAEE